MSEKNLFFVRHYWQRNENKLLFVLTRIAKTNLLSVFDESMDRKHEFLKNCVKFRVYLTEINNVLHDRHQE